MTNTVVNYSGGGPALLLPHMAVNEKETMGQRIMRLIQANGYTQSSFARAMDAGRATVNQWVKDYSKPTPKNLLLMCDLLHTDPHYLVFGPTRAPDGSLERPDRPTAALRGTTRRNRA